MQYDNQDKIQAPASTPKPAKASPKTDTSTTNPAQQPAWTQALVSQPPAGLQAKLTVNQPGDAYEQEADRVAEQVIRMPATATPGIQEDVSLMRKENGAPQATQNVPPIVNQALNSGGQPLDASTRAVMEPRFGHDFSYVRVHTDEQADESAQAVNARAYTVGKDVVFGAGHYEPGTSEGQRLLAHELTHVVQQKHNPVLPVQRFAVTDAADVPSLAIEEESQVNVPGKWGQLGNKLQQRDRLIAGKLALVKEKSAEHATLIQLQNRWQWFRTNISSHTFNPSSDALPSSQDIAAARTDELRDMHTLTGRADRFLRGAIQQFVDALDAYLRERGVLSSERTEYQRFDNLFASPDVLTLVGAIPHASFTSADVKALVDQETGDLTNVEVAGIDPHKPGIITHRRNRGGHVGFGQHTTSARDEAITWAKAQGVKIPHGSHDPDPRTVPEQSIKLTAAYLGRVMDMLWPGLPEIKPTGDELKKLVFAAYNGGQTGVITAARAFLHGKRGSYSWNDIQNQAGITPQMRDYVSAIVRRLS